MDIQELKKIKEENRLLNEKERKEQTPICKSLPISMWIDITTRCNINCFMCPRTYDKSFKGHDMSIEVFDKIKNTLFPTLSFVELQGYGEPMLAKNFDYFYNSAVNYGVDVRFVTNGTLLNKENMKTFIENNTHIFISMDAPTEQTFDKIRPKANFNKIISNIEAFYRIKANYPNSYSNIYIMFVAMRQNIEELPQMVEFCSKLGVGFLNVSYFYVNEGIPKEHHNQILYNHKDLADNMFRAAKKRAEELNFTLNLPAFFNPENNDNVKDQNKINEEAKSTSIYPQKCFDPWAKVYVDCNGMVKPCCAYNSDVGDLNKEAFGEIWNNQKYQKLRRKVNSNFPPLLCKECTTNNGIAKGNPKQLFDNEKGIYRLYTKAQRLKRKLGNIVRKFV